MVSEIISNQYIFYILLIISTAVVAGFLAGLFGIGGGLITIPILVYIFKSLSIENEYIMHLAVGTSFSIIIPTALVSVITHNKLKAVDFNIMKSYGVFVIIGVLIGTFFASTLNSKSLILIFSIILFIMSVNFFYNKNEYIKKLNFNLKLRIFFGFIVGFISSLMGIAGAIMNVPILKSSGYSINRAIGTSAFIGLFISIFGAIGFIGSGILLNSDLPLSIGFVYVPAFLIFTPITSFMARLGAKTVHKIEKNKITIYFSIFLFLVASKFMYDYLAF